eukprot:XP_016657816.1 PREDICTED: zinc finger SWIM domain-containing protein 1-like [Acyrthosiphon pisum]
MTIVVDSNGLSEIVGFCLLTSEDQENVSDMASTFKKHNPQWKNIKCIMADKDFTERNVFKQQFPSSQILICIFHCLRSMSREITSEKMKINSEERAMCLEIIQSIVYAKNAIHYDEIHKKLEGTNIKSVIDYFNKNWHSIRIEWVIYFQSKFMTLGNRTNNRLESINQKITQVVTKFSRLDQLFQGLDMLMVTLRTERDHIATECFSKTPSFVSGLTSEIKELFWYLTPYAFGLVQPKLNSIDQVKVISHISLTGVINSREGTLNVTTTTCECSFVTSMCLPCHHIFKLRKIYDLSLYCPELCADRWTRKYYQNVCRVIPSMTVPNMTVPNITEQNCVNVVTVSTKKKRIYNQHEKFQYAYTQAKRLASLASEASGTEFQKRLKLLNLIANAWETNQEVNLDGLASQESLNETEDLIINEPEDLIINEPEELQLLNDLPILPPRIPKRGRPKGNDKTAIGIPKKRKIVSVGLVSFHKLPLKLKQCQMLKWVVDEELTMLAMDNKKMIGKNDVERIPERVSNAIIDDTIALGEIKRFFTADGWTAVQQIINFKKQHPSWLCPVCSEDSSSKSICCNRCLEWSHFTCARVNENVKSKLWFCNICKSAAK